VFLFGSAARGEEGPRSDVDVSLVLTEDAAADTLAASRKRLDYMAASDLDVRVFQRVPLYIRHRILKEGRLLFSRDEDLVYELAVRTAREFERFKPIYREYLEQVARAGS
jgi:predicted nucleotidyltransferase